MKLEHCVTCLRAGEGRQCVLERASVGFRGATSHGVRIIRPTASLFLENSLVFSTFNVMSFSTRLRTMRREVRGWIAEEWCSESPSRRPRVYHGT